MSAEQVEQIIDANSSDGLMTRQQVIDWLKEHYGIDAAALGISA